MVLVLHSPSAQALRLGLRGTVRPRLKVWFGPLSLRVPNARRRSREGNLAPLPPKRNQRRTLSKEFIKLALDLPRLAALPYPWAQNALPVRERAPTHT